jgi:hypothetical protein
MEKGLPFDGVRLEHARISINKAVQPPFTILAHSAISPFSLWNKAMPRAQFTLNPFFPAWRIVRGELRPDKPFLGHLCLKGSGGTDEVSETQATETPCTKLQEVPPHKAITVNALIRVLGSPLCWVRIMHEPIAHWIFWLNPLRFPGNRIPVLR